MTVAELLHRASEARTCRCQARRWGKTMRIMSKSTPCRPRHVRHDGVITMRLYEPVKVLPPVGIGNSLSKKISITALTFVTVIACATSASAQSARTSAPPTTSFGAAIQAQNPLSPVYSLLNENSTNFNMGPLERTQDVLLVEPVIPIRLTPNFNLITRWITPVIWQPALAPSIRITEFGLGNITPQFFFTPAHQGNGFVWGLGAQRLASDCDRRHVGNQRVGWRTDRSGLWIQGPLLFGVLANQTWAGDQSHGSSATCERINQMLTSAFRLLQSLRGMVCCLLPLITADWTVPEIANGQCRSAAALGGCFRSAT